MSPSPPDDDRDRKHNTFRRRAILSGLGSLGAGALVGCDIEDSDEEIGVATGAVLSNLALTVTGGSSGIIGYSPNSVAAGSTIDFHISTTVPYQMTIQRLGWLTSVNTPSKDWAYATLPAVTNVTGLQQVVRPGSYIHATGLSAAMPAMSLECWVRPYFGRPHWQGIITQYHYPTHCGFGLFLTSEGKPACYFGNGGSFNGSNFLQAPNALQGGVWSHVVAVFSGGVVTLYVNGHPVATSHSTVTTVTPPIPTLPDTALRIGAYADSSMVNAFFDGDIAMPVVYSSALSAATCLARFNAVTPGNPPQIPSVGTVAACWPLTEETGPTVADVSPAHRTGTIINRGTWMIGGPGFDPTSVGRFDTTYNPNVPATMAARGHAIRLSATDLYDCGWQTSVYFPVPESYPPGLYVARLSSLGSPPTTLYEIPFVVRPAPGKTPAPVAVLCATNTWHAYQSLGTEPWFVDAGGNGKVSPDYYTGTHDGGQITMMVGINLPLPNALSQAYSSDSSLNAAGYYGHLARAERPLHNWLEQNGYEYDLFTDEDLHRGRFSLANYQALFIVGHSEYWSSTMYNSLKQWLDGGGQLICASGNTMFWRVSIDDQVIQCRKYCDDLNVPGIAGTLSSHVPAGPGQAYHEGDHARGGLMREAGMPCWRLTGLESNGFGEDHSESVVTNPGHFLLTTPETTGAGIGTSLGLKGVGGEFDATLAIVPPGGSPAYPTDAELADYHPEVFAEGHSMPYGDPPGSGDPPSNNVFDYGTHWTTAPPGTVINQMAFSTRPLHGGQVLATGSIATACNLLTDPLAAPPFSGTRVIGKVFRNALYKMGVKQQLMLCAVDSTGHLWRKIYEGSSSSFGSWSDLGVAAGGVAFASAAPLGINWSTNRLGLMAVDVNDHLHYNFLDASSGVPVPTGWQDFGLVAPGSRPAVVAWGRNRVSIYIRINGHIKERTFDGANWGTWIDLGGGFAGDPAAVLQEGRRIVVAAVTTAGHLAFRTSIDGLPVPPGGWTDMGLPPPGAIPISTFTSTPTLMSWGGNAVTLFAIRDDGQAFAKTLTGTTWSTSWTPLSGHCESPIAVATSGPRTCKLFTTNGGHLESQDFNGDFGSGWVSVDPIDLGGGGSQPSAAAFRGESLCLVAKRFDGPIVRFWNGTGWSSWTASSLFTAGPPNVFTWVAS